MLANVSIKIAKNARKAPFGVYMEGLHAADAIHDPGDAYSTTLFLARGRLRGGYGSFTDRDLSRVGIF